jgi:hypothetical protein
MPGNIGQAQRFARGLQVLMEEIPSAHESSVDPGNAAWCGAVPSKRCVRVREGGRVLQTIKIHRSCFACMLAARTLFMVIREWRGLESMSDKSRTGQLLNVGAPARHSGWPWEGKAGSQPANGLRCRGSSSWEEAEGFEGVPLLGGAEGFIPLRANRAKQ